MGIYDTNIIRYKCMHKIGSPGAFYAGGMYVPSKSPTSPTITPANVDRFFPSGEDHNAVFKTVDMKTPNPAVNMKAVDGLTDVTNYISAYAKSGELPTSDNFVRYLASLAVYPDRGPLISKILAPRLESYAGSLTNRKDVEAYVARMRDLQKYITAGMAANYPYLIGAKMTDPKHREVMTQALTPAIENSVFRSLATAFRDDSPIYGEYFTPEYLDKLQYSMLNGIGALASGTKHQFDTAQLAQHALLYKNNKAYREAFDKGLSKLSSGWVNKDTTPDNLLEIKSRLEGFNPNIGIATIKGLPIAQQLQILAANRGIIPTGDDLKDIMDTNINGMTKSVMSGVQSGLFNNWEVLLKDPRAWVRFAAEQKILPSWAGDLAKNRELFWGTLIGGGALAVGGISALVSSFLSSRKNKQDTRQQAMRKDPSGYANIPQTTSLWRAG